MFTKNLTNEIIQQVIKNNFGITKNIVDRHIIINQNNIIVKISINYDMNVLEIAKILQNQIYIELVQKTDIKNFKVDIVVSA